MGFYGNITNTSKTQFQFDKIYSNRTEMDKYAMADGVYVGRYVLVEYSRDSLDISSAPRFYKKTDEDGLVCIYTASSPLDDRTRLKCGAIRGNGTLVSGDYVLIPGMVLDENGNKILHNLDSETTNNELWQCVGAKEGTTFAIFKKVYEYKDGNEAERYAYNYRLDTETYGASRGYDSTVWQKVYNNGEKYVMIAELNSVVPTFDLASADSPSLVPLTPHFDSDSTNVYYKLHWQPAWGFRIKAANADAQSPTLDKLGYSTGELVKTSIDNSEYPSDEKTRWTLKRTNANDRYTHENLIYDQRIKDWVAETTENIQDVDAAIYYNKAGFDSDYITDTTDYDGLEDKISVEPTGISGKKYSNHDEFNNSSVEPDIQEMSIILPSIGNAISEVWDTLYGNKDLNGSNIITDDDGRTKWKRNKALDWKDAKAADNKIGHRLINNIIPGDVATYNQKAADTVAGAINSVHDLMGMIIVDENSKGEDGTEGIDIDKYNDEYIYYDSTTGRYNRKHLTYEYTPITNYVKGASQYSRVTLRDWNDNPNGYYFIDSAKRKKEYIKDRNYYPDRQYVSRVTTKPSSGIQLTEEFEPGLYFEEKTDNELLNSQGNLITRYNTYFKSTDIVENINKSYFNITREVAIDPAEERIYIPGVYYTKKFNRYEAPITESRFSYGDYYLLKNTSTYEFASAADVNNKIAYVKVSNSLTYRYEIDGNRIVRYIGEEKVPNKTFVYDNIVESFGYVEDIDIYNGYYTVNYSLDNNPTPLQFDEEGRPVRHYLVTPKQNEGAQENTYIIETQFNVITLTQDTYMPDKYYHKKPDAPEGSRDEKDYILDTDAFDVNETYYNKVVTLKAISGTDKFDIEREVLVENLVPLSEYSSPEDGYLPGLYWKNPLANGTFMYVRAITQTYSQWNVDGVTLYKLKGYKLGKTYKQGSFYYRFEDETDPRNGSYFLDMEEEVTRGRTYFESVSEGPKVTTVYYAPNTYYVYNNSTKEYELDNSHDFSSSKTYYKSNKLYVISDSTGVYKPGSEWNPNADKPDSVTLGSRTEKWELKEIPELGTKLNTIFGLILKINNLLEFDNNLTRDRNTVQGAINSLNDIIDRIAELKPNNLLIVDKQGRINDARIIEDSWINLDVSGDVSDPTVTVGHKFTAVSNTASTSDMNTSSANTIALQTPIVDDKGHVVGKNTETVTLPFGFKILKSSNNSGDDAIGSSAVQATTGIVADSTQDTLNIGAYNKWIEFTEDTNADKLSIGHAHSALTSGEHALNAQTPTFGGNFNIRKFTTDKAGHLTAVGVETVTIPAPSISNGQGNIVTGLSWSTTNKGQLLESKANIGTLALTGYSKGSNSSALLASDTLNGALAKLENQIEMLSVPITNQEIDDLF